MSSDPSPNRQIGLSSNGALLERYDLLLVDLDGVVYLGEQPIPGAAAALTSARGSGAEVVFVTNNAGRPPAEVAEQLTAMGVAATSSEVMTSAVAAAQVLAKRLPAGAAVLVVGGAGVRDALESVNLRPVSSSNDAPRAVLQGFGPEVGWRALAEASIALRAGAAWIATNGDLTLPSPRGPLPGNGSLVAALSAATGLTPEVIGKPGPILFDTVLATRPNARPLVIGDRLDTDIAGGVAAGVPTLLVLTGVSGPRDLLSAPVESRPTYLGWDLGALMSSSTDSDGLDPLRELCRRAWAGALDPGQYDDAIRDLNLDLRSRE